MSGLDLIANAAEWSNPVETWLTLSTRGSGSSNTTKTNSTDDSSRHSNASTTPSSADLNGNDDWRLSANKKSLTETYAQPSSRPNSGFLKSGRSWSFGASKKQSNAVSVGQDTIPATPPVPDQYKTGRARATTSSTDATVTPPQLEQDFKLDLGGSFSKMLLGFDKRSSVMTLQDDKGRQVLQPSAMTGGRVNAPSPIQIDRTAHVEPPPHSWASHRSNENLLLSNENIPPPVPKHGESPITRPQPSQGSSDSLLKRTSAIFSGRRKSFNALDANHGEGDDLNSALLAVNRFMSSDANSRSTTPIEAISGRQRKYDDTPKPAYTVVQSRSPVSRIDPVEEDDDNMFDNIPLNTSRFNTPRQPPPPKKTIDTPAQTKVMTPLEFEKYRKDKEVESRRAEVEKAHEKPNEVDHEDEDEINYEDDEDEAEKSKQLAKQRKKQEAHMSVYRQQMMKVTGETPDLPSQRPGMTSSFSTPNLGVPNLNVPEVSRNSSSDVSEDDEEVPLAILAAHGFPNKNRPPTRLTTMMSNPNLRQAAQPSYQRPGSAAGHAAGGGGLPPFARGLPQDPYGLVNSTVRESFALGGGVPAGQNPPVPPGGLVGVIANEERARSMRRGSPQVPPMDGWQGAPAMGPGGFDPMQGIPPQMMYPQNMAMQNPMMTPGEQAQLQLSQQMSQFMQMQMQFMQMQMMGQSNNTAILDPPRSAGHNNSQSLTSIPTMNGLSPMGMDMMNPGARGSYLEPQMLDPTRSEMHPRTMSMVQPSSASWLQAPPPPRPAGYAGSIRGQGQGYAPSVAPSERSNVGLPGRYRPVSQMPPPAASTTPDLNRKSYMSGSFIPSADIRVVPAEEKSPRKQSPAKEEDDDDEEGWAAMKAKREKKKSGWRSRKTAAPGEYDIGSLIT